MRGWRGPSIDLERGARDVLEWWECEIGRPRLSLCVPTHHGRRDVLGQLLDSVLHQVEDAPGRIEICISDNASRDGTAELIQETRRRARCEVVYHRQPENVGLGRNLLQAVELASGEYCWLLGSDDLLAPGALRRACELIERLPGAAGYVVGTVYVDEEDPTLRSRQLPRAFHPPGDEPRLFHGFGTVLDDCGNSWISISWQIVDRERWLRVARAHRTQVLSHATWPQIIVLARMARELPRWGWLAAPLVQMRNADPFVFERGDVALADRWSELIGGLSAAWADVLGEPKMWRRRMAKLHRIWGTPQDARATKLYETPSVRAQIRMALTWARAFGHIPAYWRDALPATLAPVWLTRLRYSYDSRWARRGRRLKGGRDRLVLTGELPQRLGAAPATIEIRVRNESRRRILSDGPRAVNLAQRWETASGKPVEWEEFRANSLARPPVSLPRHIWPGGEVLAEIALYAPAKPGNYRLTVAPQQHPRWLDQSGVSNSLTGHVSIDGTAERPSG